MSHNLFKMSLALSCMLSLLLHVCPCRDYRKKHHKDDKEEIDALISYISQNGTEVPFKLHEDRMEALHSADTLCKYCGQEFEFASGLQHHLRSQGGCLMKPYSCRLCSHSFSNKVNALRHMQRLHNITDTARMEEHITVKEAVLDRIKDLSPCVSPCPSSASTSPRPTSVTPPPDNNRMRLPIQPPASTSPRPGSAFSNYKRDEIKPAHTPIDFSMRSTPKPVYQDANNNISDDQPMDLSTKSKPSPSDADITHSPVDVSRGFPPSQFGGYGLMLPPTFVPPKVMGQRPMAPFPQQPHMAFRSPFFPPMAMVPPNMFPFARGPPMFPPAVCTLLFDSSVVFLTFFNPNSSAVFLINITFLNKV